MEISSEDIKLDCQKQDDRRLKFSRKFKILLGFSIFITFIESWIGIAYFTTGISQHMWEEFGMNDFVVRFLYSMVMLFICITLIKIAVSKKPFSRTLVKCLYCIGGMLIISGIICPLLPGFRSLGFEILSYGSRYIEGYAFCIGWLFVLFGRIMLYGLNYQEEMDTTI